MPFGLLPNMRILVRNVLPQKRKYYKSTLLTSFEVLGYESRLMFETANLYAYFQIIALASICKQHFFRCTDIGRKDDWGNAFSLGCGYLIPNGVLVCSRITTLKIRSLRLFHAPGDEKLQVVMTYVRSPMQQELFVRSFPLQLACKRCWRKSSSYL